MYVGLVCGFGEVGSYGGYVGWGVIWVWVVGVGEYVMVGDYGG